MTKLKPAVFYSCSTKIKAIACFYLLQYAIFALIYLIILFCTGSIRTVNNGLEINTAVFVSITGVLSFKEDFKALLQNGYTRTCIFLATVCMFAAITGLMAVMDTAIGSLLHRLLPGYFTLFGLLYGYGNPLSNWMWLTVFYLLLCCLLYLAVLVINKVGKTTSLLIGVGLAGVLLILAALFRFVISPETAGRIVRFAAHTMGFLDDGTTNVLFPILSFLGIGVLLGGLSYVILRRTELK